MTLHGHNPVDTPITAVLSVYTYSEELAEELGGTDQDEWWE